MSKNEEGTFYVDEEAGELILKDGDDEQRFIIDEEIEIGDNRYLILVPSADDDSEEALALKFIKEGDDEVLSIIDDESEFEEVKAKYLAE